jgi:hypothetical protein
MHIDVTKRSHHTEFNKRCSGVIHHAVSLSTREAGPINRAPTNELKTLNGGKA